MNAAGKDGPWDDLAEGVRPQLPEAYGHWLDIPPPACSLEEKNACFTAWLAARGVAWTHPAERTGKAEGR